MTPAPNPSTGHVPTGSSREKHLGDLPPRARRFVAGVIALGAIGVLFSLTRLTVERPALLVQMIALALLTATVKLQLPLVRNVSTLSLSNALNFAAMLLLDTGAAVLIGVVSAWGQCTFNMRSRNPLHRTLFSMATVGLAALATAEVLEWILPQIASLAGPARSATLRSLGLLDVFRGAVPSALVYFAVNSTLVAAAVGLSGRQSIYRVWTAGYLWSAPGYFVAAAAGWLVLHADGWSQTWGALVAVPLYLTYRSYRAFIARIEEERAQVRQLSDVQLATIEALALAIEVKDHTSQSHIQRFQVYTEGLARALAIDDDDIRGIKTAALLHDIGNLAVPEHILGKPGALTEEEFQKLQIHPRVGADIVESVPFPYPVAPLILAHHEHWDGSGYPNGLAGDQIPLGARVLTVVDFFTALLTDRPYRPARSFGEAIALLREHAGTVLDPTLVDTFLEILPELEQRVREVHATVAVSRKVDGKARAAAGSPLEDIAGAHHEAKVLYEIAHALGSSLGLEDTFSLLAEKLGGLLPHSACALFLADGDDGVMTCRWARGVANTDLMRQQPMRFEELAEAPPRPLGTVRDSPGQFATHLAAPLMAGGRQIGALVVYHVDAGAFGPEHRRLLDLVAQQAATVVQNSVVFEQTQAASLTDPLTGLANRRALQQRLAQDLGTSGWQQTKGSVLLLDLDGLKVFNDNFGHHVGDRAIREVAGALVAKARRSDLSARYAGDEFVVVLRNCGLPEARLRATEIQDAVSAIQIEVSPGERVNLSISVGVAVFPDDGSTQEALIAVADERMYLDKVARKRKVVGRSFEAGRDAA
jgi:diguanylate cyclase (GGDEF)-like protein